jgi:hypothetical protein
MMQNKYALLSLFFIVTLLFHGEVQAMFEMYLFSEVKGALKDGDKPIANAVVKRSYQRSGSEKVTEEQITDANGRFSFPNAYTQSLWYFVPHEPVITQFIKVTVDNAEYQLLGYEKHNYEDNGELDGKSLNLMCDINNPEEAKEATSWRSFVGICNLVDSTEEL